ncbi:hypothetical protein [Streptomonospora alba]|uniref:hypothetical protein n=1 Tax=Streptomonospora alba TaxID=183763 RepID=UPI0012EEB263|nr:hypothetical protein [Streptomonospora alba]
MDSGEGDTEGIGPFSIPSAAEAAAPRLGEGSALGDLLAATAGLPAPSPLQTPLCHPP